MHMAQKAWMDTMGCPSNSTKKSMCLTDNSGSNQLTANVARVATRLEQIMRRNYTTVSSCFNAASAYLAPHPLELCWMSSLAVKLSKRLSILLFQVMEISFSDVALAPFSTWAAMPQFESLTFACHCTC